MNDASPNEINKGAQEQTEENANDIHSQGNKQIQQEVTMGEEMMYQDAYEQQAQQVPLTKLEQDQEVPVQQ